MSLRPMDKIAQIRSEHKHDRASEDNKEYIVLGLESQLMGNEEALTGSVGLKVLTIEH